jgi:hypothetical protein
VSPAGDQHGAVLAARGEQRVGDDASRARASIIA